MLKGLNLVFFLFCCCCLSYSLFSHKKCASTFFFLLTSPWVSWIMIILFLTHSIPSLFTNLSSDGLHSQSTIQSLSSFIQSLTVCFSLSSGGEVEHAFAPAGLTAWGSSWIPAQPPLASDGLGQAQWCLYPRAPGRYRGSSPCSAAYGSPCLSRGSGEHSLPLFLPAEGKRSHTRAEEDCES